MWSAMPPYNAAREARLADAAIEVLAREGSRGLTHRAVDAQAGEPPGTTSRYFRTRDALVRGVVARASALHFDDLGRVELDHLDPAALGDHFVAQLRSSLTMFRSRHVAMLELFMESVRRPELREHLTGTRQAQIEVIRRVHAAAGVDLPPARAATLAASLTGLYLLALTTPAALGPRGIDDLDDLVRTAVAASLEQASLDQSSLDQSSVRQ